MARRLALPIGLGIGLGLLAAGGLAAADDAPARGHLPFAEDAARGQVLYRRRCAVCHGPEGKGDGSAARWMIPRPRDLTSGAFKLRSTPTGEPVAAEDVADTLRHGMPGSAMPSWAGLTPWERWQLTFVVLRMAGLDPQALPPRPHLQPHADADLANGLRRWQQAKCAECHGPLGRGDGPAAPTLVDEKGRSLQAADLRRARAMRTGGRPEAVYLAIANGFAGTPMPGYAGAFQEKDLWDLVAYVRSLALDD